MIAYKLLTRRADGSLGPLFINRKQRVPIGEWLEAECHPTPGYQVRPGWHCTTWPVAPHLSPKGRVWCLVEIEGVQTFTRPICQGGTWLLAKRMRVISTLDLDAMKATLELLETTT